MLHRQQVSIATGSHSLRSANDSESTLPRSARHFGERMCRFARDAVGRAPELELAWGSELEDGLSCLGPPTDVAQRAGGWESRPPAHTMSIAGEPVD
jgi:hypothetical protein